jgi:hypothetical protein
VTSRTSTAAPGPAQATPQARGSSPVRSPPSSPRRCSTRPRTGTAAPAEEGPDFGSPHQQQNCTLSDGTKRVRLAGLFKDTFLTCQVQAPAKVDDKTLSERTYDWCVQVANATNIAK